MWVEVSPADAQALALREGDLASVESRRGELQGRVRVSHIREGVVFVLFHYGDWDREDGEGPRAANELTRTSWDPVSKQPQFKVAAVASGSSRGRRIPGAGSEDNRLGTGRRGGLRAPGPLLRAPPSLTDRARECFPDGGAHSRRRARRARHLRNLAAQCDRHAEQLRPFAERYGEDANGEPERLHREIFGGPREGPLGALRDLHDLFLMACECDIAWTLVGQAAQGARDRDLLEVVQRCEGETATQITWARNRMKEAAPQALVVAS